MTRRIGPEIHILNARIWRNIVNYEADRGIDEPTVVHGWVLSYLADCEDRGEAVYQKDIEARFYISRSSVTGIVQFLEKKGYIYRTSVSTDARLKQLGLTEEGRRIQEVTRTDLDYMDALLEQGITEEERACFWQVLEKLESNIEHMKEYLDLKDQMENREAIKG